MLKQLTLIVGLSCCAPAQTLIVTTAQDVVDPSDGVLSLREAIIAANNNVNAAGECNGVTDIHFSLPGTNAVATYGTTAVPYYKLKINYHDPEYAGVMNSSPGPTTLPHVRCPINLDGYTQPGVGQRSPLIEISGEDLPLVFQATPDALRGTGSERSSELLTLHGRLVRQPEAGPTLVGCRPEDSGCPLKRTASGSTIRGIMFNHAPQTGLSLVGAENVTITGNYFGLDATGENPAPNGRRLQDVRLFSLLLNGASNNTIGTPSEPNYFGVARSHSIMMWPFTGSDECGETSPANATCGRMDIGSSENVIQSNYFGLNKGGTRSLGAICMLSAGDRRFPGESGCEPGLDRSSALYTNGGPHIYVYFYPGGVPASRNSMRRNRIGGTKPGEGNVFVAAFTGVHVKGVDTEVLGNIFGLDSKGVGAGEIAPFFRTAVIIQTDATGTLLSENIIANSAIYNNLNNAATTHGYAGAVNVQGTPGGPGYTDDLPPNIISRNNIGVNVHRQHPGVNLLGLPATNAGGGVTSVWMLPLRIEDNVIAYNGYLGAAAITARTNVVGNVPYPMHRLVVLGNSMYCNGAPAAGQTCGRGIGIDWHASPGLASPPSPGMGGDGPTLNDDGDVDDGPAELQNNPVLKAAQGGVAGRLSSKPGRRYRIQMFSSPLDSGACVAVTGTMQSGFESDPACADSGVSPAFLAVQGDTLLREFDVETDSNGVAEFLQQTPSNRLIAATATELSEDGRPLHTSELGQAVSTRQP